MDNSTKKRPNLIRNIKSAVFGIVIGLIFNAGVFLYQYEDTPVPYNNVARFNVEETVDGNYLYQATFEKLKDSCHFERLAVLGKEVGQSHSLKWVDNDGFTGKENRVVGDHVLDITIFPEEHTLEEIEIRTRHVCGKGDRDILVTKVFDEFPTFEVDGKR